jgi:hypothetical protein
LKEERENIKDTKPKHLDDGRRKDCGTHEENNEKLRKAEVK